MKTFNWTVLFLAFVLLVVPVLVVGTMALYGKSEKQGELTRMTVRSALRDAFQIYAEAGIERLKPELKEVGLDLYSALSYHRGHRVIYDFGEGLLPMAFVMADKAYIDPRQRSWLLAKMAAADGDVVIVTDMDRERPALNPAKCDVLLERADELICRSADVAEVQPMLKRVVNFRREYERPHALDPGMPLSWYALSVPLRSAADGAPSSDKQEWVTQALTDFERMTSAKDFEDRPDTEQAWLWLGLLESAHRDAERLKEVLASLESSLKDGAIHLPDGAWSFFKTEILRLRGPRRGLPLSRAGFERIERRREACYDLAKKVAKLVATSGMKRGRIPGTKREFLVARGAELAGLKRLVVVWDFGFVTSRFREQRFRFHVGGTSIDLTRHVTCPGSPKLKQDLSHLLFQHKYREKPDADPLVMGLHRAALDEALAAASVGGSGRTWVLVSSAAALLLGFVILTYIIHRERRIAHLRTQFVSNVSHELKTPVALIRLYADSLLMGRVPEAQQQREYYQVITREAQRLTALVDNVLDFSRIERGLKAYSFEDTDLAKGVDEVLETFRGKLQDEGFSFEFECAERPFPLRADSAALTQIVFNLVDNAVKFSRDHKAIRITLTRGDRIELKVIDRGIGVPKEARNEIFEPFRRLEDEMRKETSGNGLGLSIVTHAAKAHGGTVRVEDTPGGGATFVVSLPRAGKA